MIRGPGVLAFLAFATAGNGWAEPVLPDDGDRIMLHNQFRTTVQCAISN